MSYDVEVRESCEHCGNSFREDAGNHTSNTSGMWAMALTAANNGEELRLSDLHGRKAGDCIKLLQAALAHMKDMSNLSAYIDMNPSNGWGSHTSATKYLEKILTACEALPNGKLDIDR